MGKFKIIGGGQGAIWQAAEAGVDGFGALKTSPRPLDHTSPYVILGHYRANLITGATTVLAANAPIAAMRWGDTSRYFVLMSLRASAGITTAFTAQQALDIEAVIARQFTVADTGGTAVSLASPNQKNRTNMGAPLVTDLRVAAAVALTPGTRTLDAVGFGGGYFVSQGASGAAFLGGLPAIDLYKWDSPGQHPVVLGKDEGIIVRLPTVQGAAGVVKYFMTWEWAEVVAF